MRITSNEIPRGASRDDRTSTPPSPPVPDTAQWRARLRLLLEIHDLHLAPIDDIGDAVRQQHEPAIADAKHRLETEFLGRLSRANDDRISPAAHGDWPGASADDVVESIRRLAAASAVPPVYDWLASDASARDLWSFLALEGGPDAGFDDLVAIAQVGLHGEPKLELARNYWDEMGRGDLHRVHTRLHRLMANTGCLPVVRRDDLPVAALERLALGSTLATNRWLQPELIGALGLIELQAGPRCRRVSAALRRIGAPEAALLFYDEHAVADPRHGKDWIDHVITPLAAVSSRWAGGIARGANWRATVNARFLADVSERFGVRS